MSSKAMHIEKYDMFKIDAQNNEVSIPLRIEAYFYAAFHLIETITAKQGFHVEKHQRVRSVLEKYPEILGNESEKVWKAFHDIENQIRPGQIYGGQVDGQKLKRVKELFELIESLCRGALNDTTGI